MNDIFEKLVAFLLYSAAMIFYSVEYFQYKISRKFDQYLRIGVCLQSFVGTDFLVKLLSNLLVEKRNGKYIIAFGIALYCRLLLDGDVKISFLCLFF